MLEQIFSFKIFPIVIFEVIINPSKTISRCLDRFVVAGVINVELFRGQQFLENVLVVFKNILNQPICLADEPAFCSVVISAEPFVVLENGEHFLIPEKFPEKS